jgi:TolA-binding protein
MARAALGVALVAGLGPGPARAGETAGGGPSPAAAQKKIVEKKVKVTAPKARKGPTAAERAKQEFAGKQRPKVTAFDDPMERNRALIEAKQAQIEERRQKLLVTLKSIYDRVQQQGGNPAKEAELLHRMAELQWESARYHYFQKRFAYEQQMEDFLAGKSKEKPAAPKPDYGLAMELYRKILREHPGYKRIDEVIFFLGDGLKLVGRDGDAAPYFQKLVKDHPNSRYVPDALLGLAEYFFKSDLLFAARDTYKKIVDRFPQSRTYNYALYKLAWTYYNLGGMEEKNFRTAIDTFKRVIEGMDREGATEKQKIEFRDQALKDLVIAFAAVKTGFQEARDYFMKRGGMKLALEMMERLAKFYLATDKDEEAIAVYRWFLSLDPNGARVPEYFETILDSLKKIGKQDRIEKEMLALVERFGPKGTWTQANAGNPELVKKAREMAESSLEYLASHNHQEAQRLRDDRYYRKAAQFYKLFVETFPDSPRAYRARFFLAEITLLHLKDPERAASYYEDVVKAGAGEFLSDAAYGRITCYHQLMQADRNRTKVGGYIQYVKVGGKEKKVFPPNPIPPWEQKFVAASDDYVRLVKNPEDAVPVMYNAAEIYFYNNHYADAVQRYAFIVDNYPQHEYALHAANNILEAYNRLERWKEIELWARRLRDNPRFKARSRRDLEKFIALAIFNQANELRAKKAHGEAAAELLRLQKEIPKSEMSDEALFSAASLYSEGKKQDLAIETFKRLVSTYPRSTKSAQASFLIGAIYEGLADLPLAVEWYERRASGYKDKKSAEARNALFNAGLLRQAMGQPDRAIQHYQRFLRRFPKSEDAPMLHLRIADLYEKEKDYNRALAQYRRFGRAYRKSFLTVKARLRAALMLRKLGKARLAEREIAEAVRLGKRFLGELSGTDKARVQRWVAHARFLEGEDLYQDYKALRLQLPERRMAKQILEKAKMLKEVTDVFEDVLSYKSAERSACALWMIGQTYQEFSQSLLEAPIPKGLTPDEEQVYKIKLQEKALPVEEKAFAAYARNLKLAAENNVFNECVQKSGEVLARVRPEEYPMVKEDRVQPNHTVDSLQTAPMVLDVRPPVPAASAAPAAGGESHASR